MVISEDALDHMLNIRMEDEKLKEKESESVQINLNLIERTMWTVIGGQVGPFVLFTNRTNVVMAMITETKDTLFFETADMKKYAVGFYISGMTITLTTEIPVEEFPKRTSGMFVLFRNKS
jgi:hypothetical protein